MGRATGIYYGWIMVAICMFTLMLMVGTTMSAFGLYVLPVSEDFGLSRATMNTGLILMNAGAAVAALLVGRLLDRYSARLIMGVSGLILAVSLIALGLSDDIWLSAAMISFPVGFAMSGIGTLTGPALVARWFTVHRGKAMALTMIGMSLGSILIVPPVALLIEALGWRMSLVTLGCVVGVLISALMPLVRNAPGPDDQEPGTVAPVAGPAAGDASLPPLATRQLLAQPRFWAILGGVALPMAVFQGILVSLVPMGLAIGLSTTVAASLISVIGMAGITGKLIVTWASDRFERPVLLAVLFTLIAASSSGLLFAGTYPLLLGCCVLLGLGTGGTMPVYLALLADQFGTRSFGTANGNITFGMAIAGACAVRYSGEVFDRTQSYDVMFYSFIGVCLFACFPDPDGARQRCPVRPWPRRHEGVKSMDLVIRNGLVVDGSGEEPFEADVAIRDGRIAEVGRVAATGAKEIDARGNIVSPGFVDIHTHYDGHVHWEHNIRPSANHGVTTVITGNCGVGFAPCRPEDRTALLNLMEGIEDIPEPVMSAGLPWNWQSFPDFLDAVEARRFDMDVGMQLPHAPLRVFVMGQRGVEREEATAEDIAAMAALAREAVEAGAMGFSTTRAINHRFNDGRRSPVYTAAEDELTGIAMGLGEAGRGVLQLITDFEDHELEFDMIERIARKSGRPLSVAVIQRNARAASVRRYARPHCACEQPGHRNARSGLLPADRRSVRYGAQGARLLVLPQLQGDRASAARRAGAGHAQRGAARAAAERVPDSGRKRHALARRRQAGSPVRTGGAGARLRAATFEQRCGNSPASGHPRSRIYVRPPHRR